MYRVSTIVDSKKIQFKATFKIFITEYLLQNKPNRFYIGNN